MKNVIIAILVVLVLVFAFLFFTQKKSNVSYEPWPETEPATITPTTPKPKPPVSSTPTQTNQTTDSSSNNYYESGDDVNGIHAGHIKSVTYSGGNYFLKIDYVVMTSTCPPVNPGDTCLINNNPLIRTFPISSNVSAKTFNSNWEPVAISLQDFANNFSTGAGAPDNTVTGGTMYSLNRITIQNGTVTEITPIYLP